MFGYYISLALRSLRATPILSALMVVAIAVGVGAAMTTLTLNYMMSRNALAHKDDVLYALQLDNWDPHGARGNPSEMPWQITYKDAISLLHSDIPTYQVAMHRWSGSVGLESSQIRPYTVEARVTSRDFFALFDIPLMYGSSWSEEADSSPVYQIVLSQQTNQKLFNGENSVGRTVNFKGAPFTVVGVAERWQPSPKVHDLNNGAFRKSAEIFLPFGLHRTFEIQSRGNTNAWKMEQINSYEDKLGSEYVWLQYWVQLDSAEQVARYRGYLTGFIREQKTQGRFPRPLKFGLSKPSEWLLLNEVIDGDDRMLNWLSLAFLLVCLLNAVALLLAKFLRKAPEAGVRRALGASHRAVFSQHLVESGCIGLVGGLAGILLTLAGLALIRQLQMGYLDTVASMDWLMMLSAIGLAMLSSLLAGLYPAWRISRTNPSLYLKTQ